MFRRQCIDSVVRGKKDYRNGHQSEPDVTHIFHRKVVTSSRVLVAGNSAATPCLSAAAAHWRVCFVATHSDRYCTATVDVAASAPIRVAEECSNCFRCRMRRRVFVPRRMAAYQHRGQRVPLKRSIAKRAEERRERMQKRVKFDSVIYLYSHG